MSESFDMGKLRIAKGTSTAWSDPTLERIIKDVQRVTGHKPSEQIIREMLAQYEPMKDLIALQQVIQDTGEDE